MLSDCKDLTDYLTKYGRLLGARATKALAPLHVPTRDPLVPGIAEVDAHVHEARHSEIFPAQGHFISAIAKTWKRQKSIFMNGEMGVGKTLCGAAAGHVSAAAGTKPYRAMVMCPDHLINKWIREIHQTCPGAQARSFDDWKEVLEYIQNLPPGKPTHAEWLIIGRNQSKYDPTFKPGWYRKPMRVIRNFTVTRTHVAACPKCGHIIADKNGIPIAADDLSLEKKYVCKGDVYRWDQEHGRLKTVPCGEQLWQYVGKPFKWAPARLIQAKMKRRIDYLVLDEVHEEKSPTSAQANAAGKLISASKHVVALTGTLIGGYANHLFPLLMRLAPHSLLEMGIQWGDFKKFDEKYGRIQTTIHTRSSGGGDERHHSHSMGKTSRSIRRDTKPGIMPQLFGDHLLDKCVFLGLSEVAQGLPDLYEEIIPVTMDEELAEHYRDMEAELRKKIKEMLVKGDMRLLGTMLSALLGYPDQPWGWGTLGYADKQDNFVPVYTPANLDPGIDREKEKALLQIIQRENAAGRKAWVYVQMTGLRDVGERLEQMLDRNGFRTKYMRASVPPRKREDWIYKNSPKLDVMISHPQIVATGLDLFAKDGNHNFPTLVFYETGYQLFTLRQSSRRSWRIGQPLPCKTVFMYYKSTMQERAMNLMGLKMAAAEQLEGKFSAEGLAAMGEGTNELFALAKALADNIDTSEERSWSKTLGFNLKDEAMQDAPPPPPLKLLRPSPSLDGFTMTAEQQTMAAKLKALLKARGR